MSKLTINEKSGKIENVYFAYVKIQRPGLKYQSKETQYSVDVIVDKATFKEMKKRFVKNANKEVDTEVFKEKYKFDPPFEGDEQYILKFNSPSHYKDGQEKPYNYSSRPKVYMPVENGIKDCTMDVKVGNGSKGTVAFTIRETQYGVIHNLVGILVEDLIEVNGTNPIQSIFGSEIVNSDDAGHEEEPDDNDLAF